MALALSAAASGDEDCIFDQQAQIAHDRELSRTLENATYLADARVHRIERGEEIIAFSRRGCVHLGISIDYSAPAAGPGVSDDEVFRRVVALVREFGGGEIVTADEVAAAIGEKRFQRFEGDAGGASYFLGVGPATAFEFGHAVRDGRLEIGILYYL